MKKEKRKFIAFEDAIDCLEHTVTDLDFYAALELEDMFRELPSMSIDGGEANLLKENQIVVVKGKSKELNLNKDYPNIYVDTVGIVTENQKSAAQKKILVTLDEIDGERLVCVNVPVSKICPCRFVASNWRE